MTSFAIKHGMKAVKASETLAITTKIVLPNDTNTLGNLFGGQLLAWMDLIASVSAHRHSKRVVVTASVNHVSFQKPISHASIVTLEAKVSRAFNSSMEIFVDVFEENQVTGERVKCNEAIYTFVAVDQNGAPIQVPELIPETEEEKERFDGALRRKQLSLILAGKMKPSEATELRRLFMEE
jgi:acyl-CoA hydrolase